MKALNIASFLLVTGIIMGSTHVAAEEMSNDEFKAYKDNIDATYHVAAEKCDLLSGNAKDICSAEAKGNHDADSADVDAKHNPTRKTQYEASIARIDADYSVAMEKCDSHESSVKDICTAEAKLTKIQSINIAKAQMKP